MKLHVQVERGFAGLDGGSQLFQDRRLVVLGRQAFAQGIGAVMDT